MNWKNAAIILLATISLTACKNDIDTFKDNYSLEITNPKNSYTNSDSINLSVIDASEIGNDSIIWHINAGKVMGENSNTLSRKLDTQPYGKLTFEASIYKDGKVVTKSAHITRLAPKNVKVYQIEEIATYPHKTESYTQGLEFYGDSLYESTGQFKESDLRITDVNSGEALKKFELPDHIFAEGMTILDNKVYQLSWQAGYGYVYDLSLNRIDEFKYGRSKEGWGLCNDGKFLYKSDGTDKIWKIDPITFEEISYVQVVSTKNSITKINELEWIDGKIYANVYQTNGITIINPQTGVVEGIVDLKSLTAQIPNANKDDNVLNGIAFNPKSGTIFVTGKRWDKMFEIKIKK
ncbi:glutaminyl-peptide cyclotransferase [Nonlabens ulvanivorans]|uniref:glutaminyl-peptide cyclotransferase n=1 Tax=Nonlabens ulvanivorans TaxID=906888 RepID=UPI0037CC76C1